VEHTYYYAATAIATIEYYYDCYYNGMAIVNLSVDGVDGVDGVDSVDGVDGV